MRLEGESINGVVVEVVELSLDHPVNSLLGEATVTREGFFRFQRTFSASHSDFASEKSCKSFLLQKLLPQTPIVQAFFNGDIDCDMVDNLSRMMLSGDEDKDHVTLYIVLDGAHCWYWTKDNSSLKEGDECLHFIQMILEGQCSYLSLSAPLRKMKNEDGGERSNLECPICLQKYSSESEEAIGLPCSHVYHSTCIDQWLRMSHNCPLCRSPVPSSLFT